MNTKFKTIVNRLGSPLVNMGPIRLRQPFPTAEINQIDPFLLLHHYGPYAISERNNPFDLGPHPHRGFEPITLLFKGEQLHRDSLGHESVVKAGDVQWTTAGSGIIHSEGPTKEFIKKGGDLEGIQLWLNLPASHKMMYANYQHVKSDDIPTIYNESKTIHLKVVAGKQANNEGLITTQTDVNVFTIFTEDSGVMDVNIPENHKSSLYLLDGEVLVNSDTLLKKEATQLLVFNDEGKTIRIVAKAKSTLLFLSGVPINEPVSQYGPYVMNTQTEILKAMRDYQKGKMGFLPA